MITRDIQDTARVKLIGNDEWLIPYFKYIIIEWERLWSLSKAKRVLKKSQLHCKLFLQLRWWWFWSLCANEIGLLHSILKSKWMTKKTTIGLNLPWPRSLSKLWDLQIFYFKLRNKNLMWDQRLRLKLIVDLWLVSTNWRWKRTIKTRWEI